MGLFRQSSKPPSNAHDLFAAEVMDQVRATGLTTEARYDPAAFAIVYRKPGEDSTGTIYLHNTYRETADASAEERAEAIHRLLTILASNAGGMTWEQARPRLRPVLRGVAFGLSVPGATTMDNPKRLLARPFLPFLNELVVVDEPTSMAYVTHVRLAEWGVAAEEVFAAARQNLAERAAGVATDPGEDRAMIRFIDDGDAYFTSMLLVPGFLAGLAPRVGGRPVAFVPQKDTLLVLADSGPAMLALFTMVEDEFREAVRSISPAAYTVDSDGRVVPYVAEPGTDLARAVHRAEVLLASSEYAGQKEALDARFAEEKVDIFCASVLVAQRPDESVFSVAVWGEDVDSLLPVADYVAFHGSGEPMTVPFPVVVEELSLVPEPEFQPLRYRVQAWPGPDVMARLRARSVTA